MLSSLGLSSIAPLVHTARGSRRRLTAGRRGPPRHARPEVSRSRARSSSCWGCRCEGVPERVPPRSGSGSVGVRACRGVYRPTLAWHHPRPASPFGVLPWESTRPQPLSGPPFQLASSGRCAANTTSARWTPFGSAGARSKSARPKWCPPACCAATSLPPRLTCPCTASAAPGGPASWEDPFAAKQCPLRVVRWGVWTCLRQGPYAAKFVLCLCRVRLYSN